MILRARFDGSVFVPEGPVELPTDRLLELDVREIDGVLKNAAESLIRALRALPKLEPGDTDAMMREIDAAQMPASDENIFGDSSDEPKS